MGRRALETVVWLGEGGRRLQPASAHVPKLENDLPNKSGSRPPAIAQLELCALGLGEGVNDRQAEAGAGRLG